MGNARVGNTFSGLARVGVKSCSIGDKVHNGKRHWRPPRINATALLLCVYDAGEMRKFRRAMIRDERYQSLRWTIINDI